MMELENYTQDDFSVEALQNGDKRAFEALHRNFYRALCYFAEGIIKDFFTSEEIAEDCLLKIWEKRKDFETHSSIKAFLYISTKNACLNYLKKIQRQNRHSDAIRNKLCTETDATILNRIVETEVLREIMLAVERLPEKYNQVMELAYREGLKSKDIAARLNIPVSTVDNRKARALHILRKNILRESYLLFLLILSGISHF